MAQGDLDIGLLHRTMVRLGELRDQPPNFPPTEQDLMTLVSLDGTAALNHLQRHTNYLRDIGLLKIGPGSGIFRVLMLTPKGQTYVQPELAEFGSPPMLPAVVRDIETQITASTIPEPRKEGLIHDLRKAIADKAPEFIAKVVVEIGWNLMSGGPRP